MEIRQQRYIGEMTPTWVNGSGEFLEGSGGRLYMAEASAPSLLMDSLPLEFAFRELLELDPADDAELVAFMGRWGLLYHPERFAVFAGMEASEAIAETDSLGMHSAVSLAEARLAALDLQNAARAVRDYQSMQGNDDPSSALRLINNGATRETQVCLRTVDLIEVNGKLCEVDGLSGYAYGMGFGSHTTLTNMICNQVLDVLADAFEWRECDNENCGRLHKSIRHRASGRPKTNKRPNEQPHFCSDACKDAVKKRQQRAKRAASGGALE